MPLVDDAHHITFLTDDMDRLVAFYERVFDAEMTLDMTEEGLRHVFLKVGPSTVLHPFQILEGPPPPPPGTMFSRGRLDHFALLAPSEEAFRELRRRIEAEAADADVRNMRSEGSSARLGPTLGNPRGAPTRRRHPMNFPAWAGH